MQRIFSMNHLLRDRTFIGVHNTIWLLNWYRAWTSIYSLCMQREMPSNNKMEKFTHHWRTLDPSPEAWSRWLKREPQDQHHVPSSFTCMGGKKRKKIFRYSKPLSPSSWNDRAYQFDFMCNLCILLTQRA